MATMNKIDILMSDLDISNEENEELVLDVESEETENRFELCLVGKFLIKKNLNVRAMKSKMADIWKPTMGINIKVLTPGLFLFQFYHKDDMNWMMNNGPWSFDNALLVTNIIPVGGDSTKNHGGCLLAIKKEKKICKKNKSEFIVNCKWKVAVVNEDRGSELHHEDRLDKSGASGCEMRGT
ncbi:hypothetical protein AgCh_032744 [Apium graveolens]